MPYTWVIRHRRFLGAIQGFEGEGAIISAAISVYMRRTRGKFTVRQYRKQHDQQFWIV